MMKKLNKLIAAVMAAAVFSGCGTIRNDITETVTAAAITTTAAITETIETVTEPVETATEPVETVTEPVETVTEPVETVTEAVETNPEPVEPALNAKAQKITKRTIIKYGSGKQNFKCAAGKSYYLYGFSNTSSTGHDKNGKRGSFFRMYYGVTARVDSKNKRVYFQPYNDYPQEVKVELKSITIKTDTTIKNLKTTWDEQYVDCKGMSDGLYVVNTNFINKTANVEKFGSVYIYITGGNIYLCTLTSFTDNGYKEFKESRDRFYRLYDEDKTLSLKSLSTTDNLCYPQLEPYYHSDTKYWLKMSDKIVDKNWPDDRKVFAIYKWMTENLAYDYYKTETLHVSRMHYYDDYETDTWALSTTKVGVCIDFTNAFATMCRKQGIPCTSAETHTHAWNMVYVNGNWWEIDITADIENTCKTEDTSSSKWRHTTNKYEGFCPRIYQKMDYIDGAIGTYDALSDKDTRPAVVATYGNSN